MYKAVIFDLDGTLLDTLEDIADSVNASLKHFGYPEKTLEEVRQNVGNGGRRLIAGVLPEGADNPDYEKVFRWYEPYYEAHCEAKTRPYEGIMELLRELNNRQIPMAVVSNKGDGAVKELCRKHFQDLIPFAVGEREGIRRKPCPDSVFEALRMISCDRESALYVGDSEVDHATANEAGMAVALVTWGFRSMELLEELAPEHLIDDPKQLLALLNNT